MTSMAASFPHGQATPAPRRVVTPPGFTRSFLEFLIVGGATLLLFPLSWLYQQKSGLQASEYIVSWTFFYAAYVINDPHFSVTYLLFYRDAHKKVVDPTVSVAQKIRYTVAGWVVPLALGGWAAWALIAESAPLLGLMIQAMYLAVGWHYVKQGFGVLAVLSARRGAHFSNLERWVILVHCFAGWAYGWAWPAHEAFPTMEDGVVYMRFGVPVLAATLSRVAFWLSAMGLVGVLTRKVYVEKKLPPLAPLGGLLISIWLWTAFAHLDPLIAYAIPALHSIQYLYFVWILKKNEVRDTPGPRFLKGSVPLRLLIFTGSTLGLGWLFFHGAPELFDSNFKATSANLGPTPYLAAFSTFVNIHHYFMDHVIWRKEHSATRYLFGLPREISK